MAALRAVPYHTTLYENLFLLRLSICFNETPVAADRCGERELLTWKPHSSSSVSIAVESCATTLQECLHEHGGGKVGEVWFDGDVPLFHVKFHTRTSLGKLIAGKSEIEKKLMAKLRKDFWSANEVQLCMVDTQLYLVCPDYSNKMDHKVIEVNSTNQEACMKTWLDSQVLELGSSLQGCRVEVPQPEVLMKLLLRDLASVQQSYELGLHLGVPESDLDDIEVNYRNSVADRRREMLRKWKRIDEQPSWSKLVKALVAINECHVARNIAEKYGVHFPSESEPETTQGKLATATATELDAKQKLAETDEELDRVQVERRQNRRKTASAREEAEVVIEDVERLEQEKQLLLEKIRNKESELECFSRLHAQLSISQREKEVLKGSIETKENELQQAKAKLEEKKEQLKKCKEKIRNLKKRIEEGVRELGERDGRIIELEKDKARAVAELESERMKSVERVETLSVELGKNAEKEDYLREKEDQLRQMLANKETQINSNLKEISDLKRRLKLALETNEQSLLQYKKIVEVQDTRMEREREKRAIEADLTVVTRNREEYMKTPRKLTIQCYKKKAAPCEEMIRGSAVTDDQFAYFTLRNSNSVFSYKWSIEKWEELPLSPHCNSGLVIMDCKLTAVGGEEGSRRTNKLFTLQGGQWVEHYPPMNTARSSPAVVSTSDGNYTLVAGGSVGGLGWPWTTTVELFHARSRRWYALTNLPQALSFPSATICGNELHIIGDYSSGYSCSLEALLSSDTPIISRSILNSLTWTLLPHQPMEYSTAATLRGELITIFSGQRYGTTKVNSIHQLVNGRWVEICSMPSGRRLRRGCFVVTPSPEKMMIVGGYDRRSVEEWVVV